MKSRWSFRFIALAAVLSLAAVACGKESSPTAAPSDSAASASAAPQASGDYGKTYSDVREAYAHMFMTGDGLAGAIAKQKKLGAVSAKAFPVRETLDKQLAEHVFLAVFAMQKGLDGAPDFDAAAKALDANSVDLSKTIGSVYSSAAGDAFLKQWRDHIRMFVDFTVGTATGNTAKRQGALNELSQYKVSFAKFLTENTGLAKVGLAASDVASLLQQHVNQLTAALDLYKSKNYAATYAKVREAYAHMFMTGDGLAAAIAKQKNLGSTTAGPSTTEITLDRLLAEHAGLAVFAMQKGAQSKPDFAAIAKALDANSVDLSKVIGSVYGAAAGDAFLKQWRDHIRMFVDFTVGTATHDDAKRNAALQELSAYKASFAKFLTENTGLAKAAGLQASAVADLLQQHVNQLTSALDSYLGR